MKTIIVSWSQTIYYTAEVALDQLQAYHQQEYGEPLDEEHVESTALEYACNNDLCVETDRDQIYDLELIGSEVCNQCGDSVASGSGKYVNRIPSFFDVGDAPFDSEWMCSDCDGTTHE